MATALQVRLGVAAVLIPSATAVLWIGGWPLALALAALGALGAREVYDLARKQDVAPLAELGYVTAALIPLATWASWGGAGVAALMYGALLWLPLLLVGAMVQRGPRQRPLAAVAVTLFGALYASATLAGVIAIRHGVNAERRPVAYLCLVLFPLVLTWICDTAAYAAGSHFGGRKLVPVLSPNKTWAGAWGGLAGALLFAVLLGTVVLNRVGWRFSVPQLLALGLLVGVAAQAGDIAESLLKREAGVKDSSSLLPGHGGVLDRLDSLYFVVPASAALYKLYGVI